MAAEPMAREPRQDALLARIPELAKQYEEYTVQCRRQVHRYAELAGQEVKTAALIAGEARKLGLSVETVSATGLIVTLDTHRPGSGVVLRADMDALPIPENPRNMTRQRSVISEDPQTSHACGHDFHVAILLGAMRVLWELREELSGKIYFCFEEGEETGSGWPGMMQALEHRQVNTAFALHVASSMEHGLVCVDDGPRMGGMVGVDATFIGRGGHGSRPDLSVNPVFAAAAALCNLSVAFANQIDANETVTLGITSIQGGNAPNVIPDTARVLGSLRCFCLEEGKKALEILKRVFEDTAHMHRCRVEYGETNDILLRPTVNDPDASRLARQTLSAVLPQGTVVSSPKWYGSESFSEYLMRYKGAFGFLGGRNEALGCYAEHHNEYFDADESALRTGIICYAAYAAAALCSPEVSGWERKLPE